MLLPLTAARPAHAASAACDAQYAAIQDAADGVCMCSNCVVCQGPCATQIRTYVTNCAGVTDHASDTSTMDSFITPCTIVDGCMTGGYTNYVRYRRQLRDRQYVHGRLRGYRPAGADAGGRGERDRAAGVREIVHDGGVVRGGAYTDPGATAADAVDGDVTASITVQGMIDLTTVGAQTLTYTATDAAGTTAQLTRTVTVAGVGCLDSNSYNYDYEATQDAGNCVAYSFGCTWSTSHNYDASANSGRCRFGASCAGTAATTTTDSSNYPSMAFGYNNLDSWCVCASFFSGNYCETNVDGCAGSPCQNGGVCQDSTPTHFCECGSGYRGADCGLVAEACTDTTGTCGTATCKKFAGEATTECVCLFGEAYDPSGQQCAPVDECSSSPCENGGACVDEVGKFRCWCADGYWGNRCGLQASGACFVSFCAVFVSFYAVFVLNND